MTSPTLQLTADERARSLANLKLERDAITLYDNLAAIEKNPERASVFQRIAANERRHAEIWASRLEKAGATVPPVGGPRPRVRLVIFLARILGAERVADLVRGLEGDEEAAYASQMTPETEAIAADEREHAAMWDQITGAKRLATNNGARKAVAEEAIHRGGRSGTLRAAVFGANDGLVSNLSLVMGVAGAVSDNHFIVLAGVAGLLAGAFSMAAGEYISMQSQREMFENQIAVEREEMRVMPEVEQEELAAIYRAKGISSADAKRIAAQLMEDPVKALDTKVREELGLDPDQLGSSWGAAIYSFIAFSIGAIIPLVPFLLARGDVAFIAALSGSFAALFAVGAAVSIVTGKSMLFSGLRQVLIGAAAAAVTYGVGSLIGANVG
ncbi:MAG: VIT1/CCC1 transporter family protein [Candidatus Limnocylindrales bacterium]